MSPRAACRLESLGFQEVYDYASGKLDWLARGLPSEGEHAGVPRARDVVRGDVVACGLDAQVGAMRERVEASPYGFGLVVGAAGTVLGRLRKTALRGDPSARVEEVMEPGPSTVRLDASLEELVERLRARDLKTAVVTTPDGRLVGV